MSTINLNLIGTVESRSQVPGLLKSPGDAVLITRGIPRWLIIACPCGSGEEFPINLDPRAGRAWRFYQNHRNEISVFPSVWRDSGSFCHYIIWKSRILVFGQGDDVEFNGESRVEAINKLTESVFNLLSDNLIHFSEIAENLGEVPWDVMVICRRLVRLNRAKEGTGKNQGLFSRSEL